MKWRKINGELIPLNEMDDDYLKNCIVQLGKRIINIRAGVRYSVGTNNFGNAAVPTELTRQRGNWGVLVIKKKLLESELNRRLKNVATISQ